LNKFLKHQHGIKPCEARNSSTTP